MAGKFSLRYFIILVVISVSTISTEANVDRGFQGITPLTHGCRSIPSLVTGVNTPLEKSAESEYTVLPMENCSSRSDIDSNLENIEPVTSKKRIRVVSKKRLLLNKIKMKKKMIDINSSGAKYAKKLKNRNDINMGRKAFHTSFGLTFAALHHFVPAWFFLPGMSAGVCCVVLMELFRYKKNYEWVNAVLYRVVGGNLRKNEMEGKFTGCTYYLFGIIFSAYFFPETAATLGICQLAIADPAASYFGTRTKNVYWSRIKNGFFGIGRNKGILGFLGGALVCLPFNYRVLKYARWGAQGIPGPKSNLFIASLALGAAGAFADLIVPTPPLTMPSKLFGVPMPPLHIDDNFVVPLISSWACTKIFSILGWSNTIQLGKYILV